MTYRIGAEHQEKYPDGRTSTLQSMSVTFFECKDDPDKLYVFHCMQSQRVEEEWKIRAGMANVNFINPRKNLKSKQECENMIGTIMEIIKDVKTFSQAIENDENCMTGDPNNLKSHQDTNSNQFSKLKSALKPVLKPEEDNPEINTLSSSNESGTDKGLVSGYEKSKLKLG
jgi:hypothetical protein